MTPRERFRRALHHQEPDRVPIDFGQDAHNGINEVGYRNLLNLLGMGNGQEVRVYDLMQRLAVVDEEILRRFQVDTRYVFANPCSEYDPQVQPDGSFVSEWGMRRQRCGYYCETVHSPLAGKDKEAIRKYPLPDPTHPSRFVGVRDRARDMYENTDYALIAGSASSLFYLCSELTGFENFMCDLACDTARVELLLDRMLEWQLAFAERYLEQVGDYVEMWWMGDDWGMQTGPIMSPETFRTLFKPRYRILLDLVRSKTSAKICMHTCGATCWVLPDLADIGVEVVHPVQPAAAGNGDPVKLKRDFGRDFVFYSNIANTTVLPNGTPEQVAQEVRCKLEALAPGGGYVFSGGHNIQADVPPENVVAMFDTAIEAGTYR